MDTVTGNDSGYKTTISDTNGNRVVGRGSTTEESQQVASEKWEDRYGDDD